MVARLAEFGNGIELFDENSAGPAELTVTRAQSFAARDLGFLSPTGDSTTGQAATSASVELTFPPNLVNTAINLTAASSGDLFNGVEVVFADNLTGDVAAALYDPVQHQLTVSLDAAQTTANTIVNAINAEGTFAAALALTSDLANDGTGIPGASGIVGTTANGANERILGRDVNPQETKGVFNSLIRLSDAVTDFDIVEIERTVKMLDDDFDRLSFARGEVGARGRALNVVRHRVEDEEVEMRSALSTEIDTDVVQAISDITARQAGMQATLQLIGRVLQLTVLDFL